MSWITVIPYAEAAGKLRRLYDRIKGRKDYIDNIMLAHSLRPHTMEGHMVLYKNVLHHSSNHLPKWFLETLGVYVSLCNQCTYCVEHHFEGLRRLLNDAPRAAHIRTALSTHSFEGTFTLQEQAMLRYARHLTQAPNTVDRNLLNAMRATGADDGVILEVNQVVSYFAYANRTVLGLGISLEGDILGLSPNASDDTNNWHHQ